MAPFSERNRTKFLRSPLRASMLAIWIACSAAGQNIAPPMPLSPPRLGSTTGASTLALTLENEIADLQRQHSEASREARRCLDARQSLRIIAIQLLRFGDADGPRGTPAVFTGMTLAQGRHALDDLLMMFSFSNPYVSYTGNDLTPAQVEAISAAIGSIELFNFRTLAFAQTSSVQTSSAREQAQLDNVVGSLFGRLEPTVALASVTPIVSHWPTITPLPQSHESITAATLADRIESSPYNDATRAELRTIVDFLRRGDSHADLQPHVRRYCIAIDSALDMVEGLADITWFTDDDRRHFSDRFLSALQLFRTPASRASGQEQLRQLQEIAGVAHRIATLDEPPAALFIAFRIASALDGNGALDPAGLSRLIAVADRMIRFRSSDDERVQREFRVIHRELKQAYEQAEDELLAHLKGAATTPDTQARVDTHRVRLDDLLLLNEVSGWIAAMKNIDLGAARAFGVYCRRAFQRLTNLDKRAAAAQDLRRFQKQLSQVVSVPFESALRGSTPDAASATGGQCTSLLRAFFDQRELWAQAWGRGESSRASWHRMQLLIRLGQLMADTTGVFHLQESAARLNRWGGWELDADALRGALSALPSRLKLATQTAIDGSDADLQSQLDRITEDAALAQLLGRLESNLAAHLDELPDFAASTLGQLIHPPAASAFLADMRYELAELCRYAMEEDAARRAGNTELAEELSRYVQDLARRLLAKIDS